MAKIYIAITVCSSLHPDKEKFLLDKRLGGISFGDHQINDFTLLDTEPEIIEKDPSYYPHEYFKQYDNSKGYYVYFAELHFNYISEIKEIEKLYPNKIFFELFEGVTIQMMASDDISSYDYFTKTKVKPI